MNRFVFLSVVSASLSDLSLWVWVRVVLAAQPTPTPAPQAKTIETFFKDLFTTGIRPIGYAVALFMFGWAAITLMLPGERQQDNAKAALYRALGGLILILLTEAIVGLIQNNI